MTRRCLILGKRYQSYQLFLYLNVVSFCYWGMLFICNCLINQFTAGYIICNHSYALLRQIYHTETCLKCRDQKPLRDTAFPFMLKAFYACRVVFICVQDTFGTKDACIPTLQS